MLTLNLEYALENHTLHAVAGFRDQESRLPNEYLGTPYESFFAATRDDDRETFQLEARIASELDGNVNYVAGLFYQTNDVEFCVLQQLGLLEFFGSAVPGILDNNTPLLLCNKQDATARCSVCGRHHRHHGPLFAGHWRALHQRGKGLHRA